MSWYQTEPRNLTMVEVDQRIRDALNSPSSFGSYAPRSIPFESVNRPLVSYLPLNPQDGDEVRYLADATNGVIWLLRYRSSAPSIYRWEFVGGSVLYSEVTTEQNTSSTSYAALSTAGPSVTLPLPGDYDVDTGCRGHANTNAAYVSMSYDIGSTAASDNDWVVANEPTGSNTSPKTQMRRRRKTGLTAVTLTAKYKTSAGMAAFSNRWMSVIPVRVGRA